MTTISTNLATATQLKSEANLLVSNGQHKQAISKYTRAYAYFTGLNTTGEAAQMSRLLNNKPSPSSITPQQINEINQLHVSIGNNTSLCYYKLNDGNNAIKFANKVLAVDKSNIKALYRRGMGYILLGRYSDAYDDLHAAQLLYQQINDNATDTSINDAIKQCKDKMRQDDMKLAQKLKNVDFS